MANPPHPIASGDTFAYAGTLSKTYTQSAPCPQPTATTSATIAITVKASATTAPGGGAASDLNASEVDNYPTQTTTTITDQVVQGGSTSNYLLYSTKSTDSTGNVVQTMYNTPQLLDKVPENAGDTWGPNDPAATFTETLNDGTAITRMVRSDGSYTDNEAYPNAQTATISIDGAASSKPVDGGGVYTIAGTSFAYAPPSGGNITLTIGSGATKKTRTFPAWFTISNNSYISDTFANNGSKTFDPGCSVNAAIGTSGNQIVETYQVLDPVLGYTETRTTTSYIVDGFGAACVKIDDLVNSYYDYQNDTTKIDYQSQNGQPNSVDHIVEFLGMTSPTSPLPALRRQSVGAVSPVTVTAHIAAIAHVRAVEVAHRMEALHVFAQRYITSTKGAVR